VGGAVEAPNFCTHWGGGGAGQMGDTLTAEGFQARDPTTSRATPPTCRFLATAEREEGPPVGRSRQQRHRYCRAPAWADSDLHRGAVPTIPRAIEPRCTMMSPRDRPGIGNSRRTQQQPEKLGPRTKDQTGPPELASGAFPASYYLPWAGTLSATAWGFSVALVASGRHRMVRLRMLHWPISGSHPLIQQDGQCSIPRRMLRRSNSLPFQNLDLPRPDRSKNVIGSHLAKCPGRHPMNSSMKLYVPQPALWFPVHRGQVAFIADKPEH
jgi:hypothetical protein